MTGAGDFIGGRVVEVFHRLGPVWKAPWKTKFVKTPIRPPCQWAKTGWVIMLIAPDFLRHAM